MSDFSVPFSLGRLVATPGALDACSREWLDECVRRHTARDWGCVDPADAAKNSQATMSGHRILSAYPIDATKHCAGFGPNTLWIITEADRSVTTLLIPEEY